MENVESISGECSQHVLSPAPPPPLHFVKVKTNMSDPGEVLG